MHNWVSRTSYVAVPLASHGHLHMPIQAYSLLRIKVWVLGENAFQSTRIISKSFNLRRRPIIEWIVSDNFAIAWWRPSTFTPQPRPWLCPSPKATPTWDCLLILSAAWQTCQENHLANWDVFNLSRVYGLGRQRKHPTLSLRIAMMSVFLIKCSVTMYASFGAWMYIFTEALPAPIALLYLLTWNSEQLYIA